MSQFYTDPSRETHPTALPDAETFYMDNDDGVDANEDGEAYESGWYWRDCFSGCLPTGEPHGPFATEEAAIEDARTYIDD